jgi:hypothetical protein
MNAFSLLMHGSQVSPGDREVKDCCWCTVYRYLYLDVVRGWHAFCKVLGREYSFKLVVFAFTASVKWCRSALALSLVHELYF